MKRDRALFSIVAVSLWAFVCAAGDGTPAKDDAVLKSMLAPGMRIEGRWIGVIRRGFEEHTLMVEPDPDVGSNVKGAYRLKFYSWTDTSGVSKAQRKGKLVDGVLTLNEPIKGYGISKSPFSVFYAVRAEGKDYLLPDVNGAEIHAPADVRPAIAYQFQRRTR